MPAAGRIPEQFFAAGYAACVLSAHRVVAQGSDAGAMGSAVVADVSIGRNGDGGFQLASASR